MTLLEWTRFVGHRLYGEGTPRGCAGGYRYRPRRGAPGGNLWLLRDIPGTAIYRATSWGPDDYMFELTTLVGQYTLPLADWFIEWVESGGYPPPSPPLAMKVFDEPPARYIWSVDAVGECNRYGRLHGGPGTGIPRGVAEHAGVWLLEAA